MSDTQLLLDIWEVVREHLSASKRTDVSVGIMRAFLDNGTEDADIAKVADEDRDLEAAYIEVYHDGENPDDEDES